VSKSTLSLWGGWSIQLSASNHQLNGDGSWSAWGDDWAVDIHIIETAGDNNGGPIPAEQMLGQRDRGQRISGNGWIGTAETKIEKDGDRDVYRLAARLGATNTLMSCWVSYVRKDQEGFARQLISAVSHTD
jgi:hypothetical protein